MSEQPSKPAGRAQRLNRRSSKSSKTRAKGYESKWDKYVKDFIAKYQLDGEQTQKAHAVLVDCKAQAARYLAGRKSQIEQLDKMLASIRKSKDKNKAKKQSELTARRGKLMAPIDQIFDKQLKPRLEKLPTRSQRRAAAQAAEKKKPATKKTPTKKSGKKAP